MNTQLFYDNYFERLIEYSLKTPFYPDVQFLDDTKEIFGREGKNLVDYNDSYFLISHYDRGCRVFFSIVSPSELIKLFHENTEIYVVASAPKKKQLIDKYCFFVFALLFKQHKSYCVVETTSFTPQLLVRFDYNYDPETYTFGFGMLSEDEMYLEAVKKALSINEPVRAYFGEYADIMIKNTIRMNKDFYEDM